VVVSIQTFGNLVNFHPHLPCLVTDGCFMPNGWFYVLPEIDMKKLESLFRHKVFKMLLGEKKGIGRKAPLLEKFRFQRSQSGQNQKPGLPRASKREQLSRRNRLTG
jgi:hypothetical protein